MKMATEEFRREDKNAIFSEQNGREKDWAMNASPEARRAHSEIDAYHELRDDWRALFETPADRTRAEHATFLNGVSQEARDLYERGATIYGDTLVIPREISNDSQPMSQVRIGSLEFTVRQFTPLLGEEKAKNRAIEFVQLGRDIAGRTADAETLLTVFKEFHNEIKRDEQGRLLSQAEQSARLESVLGRMRELAAAMREQEWAREPVEIVSLGDWERTTEVRQRDAENELSGRLTYHIEGIHGFDLEDEIKEQERARVSEYSEELAHANRRLGETSYERISLNDLPPRLPQNLSSEDESRLRHEIIPLIDRLIESGVPPRDIIGGLSAGYANEERRERDMEAVRLLSQRAPEFNREHAVTRDEEARAVYTLYALDVTASDAIWERNYSERERAAAIDAVGARLAQDYRDQLGKLRTFSELETEREQLARAASDFREWQRATPEFRALLATAHSQEHEARRVALLELTRGNDPKRNQSARNGFSNYSDLISEPPPLSGYARLKEENELRRRETREQLSNLLINPEIEKAQIGNETRLEAVKLYFKRIAGREIGNSNEAKTAIDPGLRRMRSAIDRLAAERASYSVGRSRAVERQPNPLYVAVASRPNLRLAVENANEYRTILAVANKLQINIQPFKSLYGEPVTGRSRARDAELAFAREYVSYRLQDETTKLRNSNDVFRQFDARLTNVRSLDDLRRTIKEIRQENYAREKYPKRFRAEADEARTNRVKSREALNEAEMKQLFLASSPAHYTPEMRDLRLSYGITARQKNERIRELERGTLAPSSALKVLLSEFERTKSENPVQTARNIKAFLADYLNPPAANRTRFSRHNLYELRNQLLPAERDYFFGVVDKTKQAVIAGSQVKQMDQRQKQVSDLEKNRAERNQATKDLRAQMEERVAAYLVSAIRNRGVQTLELNSEALQHAANVGKIIKESFKQAGLPLKAYELNNERIAAVAGKLVGELPHTLSNHYKQIGVMHEPARTQSEINRNLTSHAAHDKSSRGGAVRLVAHKAIEPLIDAPHDGREKEVINERVEEHRREQLSGRTAVSKPVTAQPRAQDIAQNQTQPESRYILSR
jgi:hypothetical protein